MATIEDLKADLESYVTSVAEIENENLELKRKISHLESERQHEAEVWMTRLADGKESWREQALQHGRRQKQRTILQCETMMQGFQSELRTQQFIHQTKDSSILLSCLLRAKSSNEAADHQRRIYEAMALTSITRATVTVQDYDIEDNHVSLFNRTHLEISLIDCCLKFRHSGANFKFPDDTIIKPNSTLSVWYGKKTHSSVRQAKAAGSLYWHSNTAITNDFTDVVDLVDKKGTVFATVTANKKRYLKHATGNSPLKPIFQTGTPHHDHFLRFDHFLSLKCDEFGEPIMGHQEPFNVEKDEDLDSNVAFSSNGKLNCLSNSASSRSSSSFNATALSITKQPRLSASSSSPSPSSTDSKIQPSSENTDIKAFPNSPTLSHPTSSKLNICVPNLKPYLFSRCQGCLSFTQVLRRPLRGVAISIINQDENTIDLSGWRLIAMGNPTQEFFLPLGLKISGQGGLKSVLTFISDTDDETLLWAQLTGVTEGTATKNSIKERKHCLEEECDESSQIVIVEGLGALSQGDILSLHLLDFKGRNICMIQSMIQSNSNGQSGLELEPELGNQDGDEKTVFGDNFSDNSVSAEHKQGGWMHSLSTLYPLSKTPLTQSPSNGCSIS